MSNLEQKSIDKITGLQETLSRFTERQLQTESDWIAVRARSSEYREYMKTKRDLEALREEFGAQWWGLSLGVREALAEKFWPGSNPNDNFDCNGLPVRVYRKDIKDFNERYPAKGA